MDRKQNQPEESENPFALLFIPARPYGQPPRRSLSTILEGDEEVEILSTNRVLTSSASPPPLPASRVRHHSGTDSDSEMPSSTTDSEPDQQRASGSQERASGSQERASGSQQRASGSQQRASGSQQRASGSEQRASGSQQRAAVRERASVSQPAPKRISHRRVQASVESAMFYQSYAEDVGQSSTMAQGDSEQSLFKHPGNVRLLKRDAKKGDPKKGDSKKGDPKKGDPKKGDSKKDGSKRKTM